MVEKQARFTRAIGVFIHKASSLGYFLTFGEAWRPDFVAEYYAKTGKGIKNSLHCLRLAVDLNTFYRSEWLDGKQEYHIPHLETLGKIWEGLDKEARWGGRFQKKDYNHYSFEHNGVK